MLYKSPPYLIKGDQVAVVATARIVNQEAIEKAILHIQQWGVQVTKGEGLYHEHQLFAGTDEQRVNDLQKALDDPQVKAILCARGGYGTTRIIDKVDWTNFKRHPKWICGFSDVTAMLTHVYAMGYSTVHSTMPQLIRAESLQDFESLRTLLFGDPPWPLQAHYQPSNQLGQSRGMLVGGNLSLLVHGIGTLSEIDTNGTILCLEEVDEYLYEVDRMMIQLKRTGKLTGLAGVAVGHLTKMKEGDLTFGMDACGIIRSHIESNIPVAFGFPFGHDAPNFAIPFGWEGFLSVAPEASELSFKK